MGTPLKLLDKISRENYAFLYICTIYCVDFFQFFVSPIFCFSNICFLKSVFRIRIGLNVDPDSDPAFYLNADPDPGQTLPKESWILTRKISVYIYVLFENNMS